MFTANIYTSLDRGMVLLQLCAGSFHTKKLCSCLIPLNSNFIHKNDKFGFLSHPLGKLGVMYALLSIARWKSQGQLPIRDN